MTGYFESAVEYLLQNEGGLEHDKTDPGGITNFGISLRFLREVSPEDLAHAGIFSSPDAGTIEQLTRDQAIRLYRTQFWDKELFKEINDQTVCNYIFDFVVNAGISTAIKQVQRAIIKCNVINLSDDSEINVDGIMGKNTIRWINEIKPELLMLSLRYFRGKFYTNIVKHVSTYSKYLAGWMNRTYRE